MRLTQNELAQVFAQKYSGRYFFASRKWYDRETMKAVPESEIVGLCVALAHRLEVDYGRAWPGSIGFIKGAMGFLKHDPRMMLSSDES